MRSPAGHQFACARAPIRRLPAVCGVVLACACVLALPAPAALAGFGVTGGNGYFEAGTCVNHTCTYASAEANPEEAFTQAAGHPPWGITKFVLNHSSGPLEDPEGAPLKRIRVDVPPGLAANPQALERCPISQFRQAPSGCPAGSVVGSVEMEAVAEPLGLLPIHLPALSGTVYNLEAAAAHLPLDFGIAVEPAGELLTPIRLFLEGHVAWWSDYHEYFEINNVPREAEVRALLGASSPIKTLMSKLNFNGRAGEGDFLTLPSVCSASTTSQLEVESWGGEISRRQTHTPFGVEGCEKVPFSPSVTVAPETDQSDTPDGATTVVQVPQKVHAGEIDTSDIRDAHVTLPAGLTLNPSAAHGLAACTAAQIGIGTTNPVECPAASQIGSVAIETDLPPGSLSGPVYLGSPSGKTITGPPYTIYLDAESSLGISVRLAGTVVPDPNTGRLEASFSENPPLPFAELRLALRGGPRAPLANPLSCAGTRTEGLFTPYTGLSPSTSATPFASGGCAAPLPFALSQSTSDSSPVAGAFIGYTFNLARADGQQYLSQVRAVLPPGLVGLIPTVTRCPEPQAQSGACPGASQIGTAAVLAGAGPEPYSFSGPVYLTGPYGGAPYGLSIPIEAAAGPFDLGRVVTRVAIGVDPESGRVIATSSVPRIAGGVPFRLRNISVEVTRSGFLLNPTSCAPLSTDSLLGSTEGGGDATSSTFQVGDCGALHFTPSFHASTSGEPSKADGASLQVTITQPSREANIRSVVAQLPSALPSRLTTLQKACLAAAFDANPRSCPAQSLVGSATAETPVLPGRLTGPAYLVSHGGAAFPDLDIILEDGGVRVVLVGNTHIKGGVTTSTFAHIPDVPVSKFELTLPMGPHSALAAYGNLCTRNLYMPTTITAQNGARFKRRTLISVSRCSASQIRRRKVRIVRWRIVRHRLLLTLQTFARGRVIVTARDLRRASRRLKRPRTFTMRIRLSRRGTRALRARRRLKLIVQVRFKPANRRIPASRASARVPMRR
jgi:hypothetical protein